MIDLLAAIRPDGQNFPLLLHVVGATILVGGLLTGASALVTARGNVRFLRLGYWTLLAVALPGLVLMRIGAQWIYTKQGWDEEGVDEPAWIMIGGVTADIGGALFLVSLAIGGYGVYRLREDKGGEGMLRVTTAVAVLLLLAYVVAVWAMAGKPS